MLNKLILLLHGAQENQSLTKEIFRLVNFLLKQWRSIISESKGSYYVVLPLATSFILIHLLIQNFLSQFFGLASMSILF